MNFTGGIGENDDAVREEVLSGMEYLGLKLDRGLNHTRAEQKISAADSRVQAWVIPTNEEIVIARDTMELI